MGAIKEGDDPEDYYIPHDKPLAFVSVTSLGIVAFIGAVTLYQRNRNTQKPKASEAII